MAAVRASPLGAVASRANPRARASSMVGGRPRVVVAIARPRASNRRRVASASADASSSSGALAVSYRTDADGAVVYRFGGDGDDDDDEVLKERRSPRERGRMGTSHEDERGSSDFEILRAADGSVMFRFADAAADASAAVNNVVTRVEDDVAATSTATATAAAAAAATATTTTTTVGEKAEERQKISAGKTAAAGAAAAGAVAAPPPARPPPRGGGSADALRPLPPALRRMSELGVRTVLDGVESAFETVRRVLSSRRFPFVRRSSYDRVRVVNFIP